MKRRAVAPSTREATLRGWPRLCLLVLVACGALALLGEPAQAQATSAQVEVEAVTMLSNRAEQPRLDVYVRVPFRSLRFLRRGEAFEGNYAVSASVYRAGRGDRPSGLVMTRSWDRRVTAATFSDTQGEEHADHSSHALDLPPGRYVLQLRIEDAGSARSATHEQVVEVSSLGGPVAMSDVIIADSYDRRTRTLVPMVGGMVSANQETFTLFTEVYAAEGERLRARYTITQIGPERRAGGIRGLLGRREREIIPVLEMADWVSTEGRRTPVTRELRTDRFGAGEYQVNVRLERSDGTVVAERNRPLTIRWSGLLDELQDLDVAIAQLRYIAKPHEIRAMREARSLDERLRLFQDFWDRRDPSPGSARNERMEEYYYRIAHANRRYGRLGGTGWETDQGEVFIRFGEPDRVEDHASGGTARPYQVWFYERIGRRFIFVDESGAGEFRLLVPIWDERTRM